MNSENQKQPRVVRTATMAAVAAWLDGSERTFWIEGPPGSGKSVIASMVGDFYRVGGDHGPFVVTHTCTASDITSLSPRSFVESISATLAAWPPFARALLATSRDRRITLAVNQTIGTADTVTGIAIQQVLIGDLAPEDAFVAAVLSPLAAAQAEFPRTVVLMVDGLDESVLRDRGSGIARLISALDGAHPALKLFVTSRPDVALRESFDGALVWRLQAGAALSTVRGELLAFVRSELARSPGVVARLVPPLSTDGLATLIVDRAVDNFLVAQLLLEMLTSDTEPIDPAAVVSAPANLFGLYRRHLGRMRQRLGHELWVAQRLPLLAYLVVAFEPLTERELASMSGLAPDKTRSALADLIQFLSADSDVPPSRRRYAIYHRSFAEFLLNADAAADNWCSERDQHRRIIGVIRGDPPWHGTRWDSMETYFLRHAVAHAAEQGAGSLDDVNALLSKDFLRAQLQREGPATVFQSLQSAIRLAATHGELTLLYRFAWINAALRDLLTQQISPATVQLYAAYGELAPDALRIDDVEDPYHSSRVALVGSLTRAGQLEDALRLAKPATSALSSDVAAELSMVIAEALVDQDPARAIQIAPRPGIGFLWQREINLCRGLARTEDLVEAAVARAESCEEALIPIALEVAKRDWAQGLELMRRVRSHKELVDGVSFYRNSQSGIAELAISLSRHGDHSIAMGLLSELTDTEAAFAATVVAGEWSSNDGRNAEATLDLIRQHSEPIPILLAVAHVLAADTCGVAEQARQLLPYAETLTEFSSLDSEEGRTGLDVLRRLPLKAIALNPEARQVALSAVKLIATAFQEQQSTSTDDRYGHLGVHWGVLDLEGAVSFAHHIEDLGQRTAFRRGIVAGTVPIDFEWAMAFAQEAQLDYGSRQTIVERLARENPDLALRFIDRFPSDVGEYQIRLLGIVAQHMMGADPSRLQQLLDRVPDYVNTWEFIRQLRHVEFGTARGLLATDPERGLALGRDAVGGQTPDEWVTFEIEARRANPTTVLPLVRTLKDPVLRASYLLDDAEDDPTLLAEAAAALDLASKGLMERRTQMARLVTLYERFDPEKALKLAIDEEYDSRALAGPVKACLRPDSLPVLFKAQTLLRYLTRSATDDSFVDPASAFRRRSHLVEAILLQLTGDDQRQFVTFLETSGEYRKLLEWRCLLGSDPKRVIELATNALSEQDAGTFKGRDRRWLTKLTVRSLLNKAIASVAVHDPDYAASVWRQRADRDEWATRVLPAIIASAARRSVEHADALAREAGSRGDEVRRGAINHLQDDPGLSLQLIHTIKDAARRGDAVEQLVRQSTATWARSEPQMMATIALVHDLKTATKQSVMQVVANHLAGKSVRLMVLALCTAALAERVVFLSTMEAFATVVARADGHESLLSMAGEIRDLFATLGRVKRTSSIAS